MTDQCHIDANWLGRRISCPRVTTQDAKYWLFTRRIAAAAIALTAIALAGCGSQGITLAQTDPSHPAAVLFSERCGGCHTLSAAGARGSKPVNEINSTDRTNGPNFDTLKENFPDVLYAIRNGGFSGSIMPANVVVGPDAVSVARFLAKYSGTGSN